MMFPKMKLFFAVSAGGIYQGAESGSCISESGKFWIQDDGRRRLFIVESPEL